MDYERIQKPQVFASFSPFFLSFRCLFSEFRLLGFFSYDPSHSHFGLFIFAFLLLSDAAFFGSGLGVCVQASGGGGFSPGKLRNMLLGLEKKRKEEEEELELGSTYNLTSQALQIDEAGNLFMLISCFLEIEQGVEKKAPE